MVDKNNYTTKGFPSGTILFKLPMQKLIIGTRKTAGKFQDNILSLDTYMTSVNKNGEDFNCYVKLNYERLKARGEHCNGVISNHFKGYKVVQDKYFFRYTATKKDGYEYREYINHKKLMVLMLNK